MSNLNITKTGILNTDINALGCMVNNVTLTNTTTDWTFGNATLSNGIVQLTGSSPVITSKTFTVNPTDIICFEFTVAVPTPSTTTGGPGLYLGTLYGQQVYVHTFNMSTKTWAQSTSVDTNPYFLYSYNLTNILIQKHYILGSSVSLSDVPWGDTTDTSYPPRAIQLPSGTTTTNIRSGYNSNSSMVIQFSNPKIYNITQRGFCETNSITASFGNNWVNSFEFIEY